MNVSEWLQKDVAGAVFDRDAIAKEVDEVLRTTEGDELKNRCIDILRFVTERVSQLTPGHKRVAFKCAITFMAPKSLQDLRCGIIATVGLALLLKGARVLPFEEVLALKEAEELQRMVATPLPVVENN